MAIPKLYAETEGGEWRDWSYGNVDGRGLKKRDAAAVTMNGITVHALAFDTGEEWDCVNGWRPEKPPATPEPAAPVPAERTAGEQAAKDALSESLRLSVEAQLADSDALISKPDFEPPRSLDTFAEIDAARDAVFREKAQEYALRIWSGQSDSVGRSERVARVKRALDGQGLSFDGVKLPGGSDDDDWTEEDSAPVTWRKDRA